MSNIKEYQNITFRSHLIGKFFDLCCRSKITFIKKNVNYFVDIVVLLSKYEEEGQRLFPSVFITNNFKAIKSLLPGSEILKIGLVSSDDFRISTILKEIAPLANNGWLVYLWEDDKQIEYGLFREDNNPNKLDLDEIFSDINDIDIIKIISIGNESVEIVTNFELNYILSLDNRDENSKHPFDSLKCLISSIIESVSVEYKEKISNYLSRTFINLLRESHGCMICVVDHDSHRSELFTDGIYLDTPIDFYNLFHEYNENDLPADIIDSKVHLIRGMLNSDGIIVFNNNAQLLGYRIFIKNNTSSDCILGGARKRAFATLSKYVGKEIKSVFIQSHDGITNYKGEEDE